MPDHGGAYPFALSRTWNEPGWIIIWISLKNEFTAIEFEKFVFSDNNNKKKNEVIVLYSEIMEL